MAVRKHYRFRPWMLNGCPGNITWAVKRVIVRGVNHGLVVTATTNGTHAPTSYHQYGKAVDMAGPGTEAEIQYQRHLIKGLGAWRFNEIFGPDNFANVKNGVVFTLVEGSGLEQMHDTHIHVAPRSIPKLHIPQWVKDRALARQLRKHGVRRGYPKVIIREARREKVPLSWALALVDQESAFQNIFGGDHGNLQHDDRPPYYHVPVTSSRVKALLRYVAQGHASNGVGPTQLTSVGYIVLAEREGGAHRPKINVRVGLRVLKAKCGGDYENRAWLFNGAPAYQQQIEGKQRKWARVLK